MLCDICATRSVCGSEALFGAYMTQKEGKWSDIRGTEHYLTFIYPLPSVWQV